MESGAGRSEKNRAKTSIDTGAWDQPETDGQDAGKEAPAHPAGNAAPDLQSAATIVVDEFDGIYRIGAEKAVITLAHVMSSLLENEILQ